MSTGSTTPTFRSRFGTPNWRTTIIVYAFLIIGASVVLYWNDLKNTALREDVKDAKSTVDDLKKAVNAGNPALVAELTKLREESQAQVQRLKDLEQALGSYDGKFQRLDEKSSEAESVRAVERAKVAVLAAQVAATREQLQKLKAMQTEWQAKEGSLLKGDPGRRIAASPSHLALVVGLLEQERPTAQKVLEWELSLQALATPIEQSARDDKSLITISKDHAQMLTDLSQQLSRSVAEFDQQQLLLAAVLRETASTAPGSSTLEAMLRERSETLQKERTERLDTAIAEARASAEKSQTERLTKVEREAIEAETRRKESAALDRKSQADTLAEKEKEQIAQETKVKLAQQQATINGLKEEATRVERAIAEAQLEREMERAMPEIRGLLSGFISKGRKFREDGLEGPVPLSYLKSQGALNPKDFDRRKLGFIANVGDRPPGGLKDPVNLEQAVAAQNLLIKFGDLMVKKGMLAP